MTTFEDGPAKGQTLMLKRAPIFLRVVYFEEWDALDLREDRPCDNEKVYVYKRVSKPSWVHINRGRNPGSGFYTMAVYQFVPEQPDEDVMRDTACWQRWCVENCR